MTDKISTWRAWLLATLREAGWAPLGVFVFYLVAAQGLHLYTIWPVLDAPTHFAGGAAAVIFSSAAIRHGAPLLGATPRSIRLLASVGLAAIVAVLWEFYEFACDRYLGTQMNQGVADTLADLFFGLLGAVAAAAVIGWKK